ncbi:MAG: hypothetical protein HN542_03905 [Flavobacteriales bacterium]|jgi:hypothetical protein|nr:hypothetical protein [Flavobacteriales bacterium]NCG29257.1 hypothetical protein [Bacteroidota bacterium]MBT3964370.1 hypothetical protein [Flavobacteriales bacterium]MBT4705154.1 hypothetical protein [Flavobacteriales bacterium]MBT4930174.1 hypothetical protein [Flavobacteriales bacterium]
MAKQETSKKQKENPVTALLTGNILTQDSVVKHLPYLLFLAFLALIYIANGYMAESSVRTINKMEQEIKELRSEQISIKSELNNTIIESELIKIIDDRNLGLNESFEPPKKLVVEVEEFESIN